jgi:hypothetical protein
MVPVLAAAPRPASAQTPSATSVAQQAQAALKDATGTKLVLLGTGAGPVPGRSRHMTSHVMLSNESAYVLDCGKSIFITHHHADHNIEYGPLPIVGWIQGMPLDVHAYGPPPLKRMTGDFMHAYRSTVDFWAEDFKMKPLVSVNVKEVSVAGPVTQDDNVKVSAIVVTHPPVKPALGYRFDFKDRSIAFSGDTAPLEAVAKMAKGADVLVHEAMYVPAVEKYIRGGGQDAGPITPDSGHRPHHRRDLARAGREDLHGGDHRREGPDGCVRRTLERGRARHSPATWAAWPRGRPPSRWRAASRAARPPSA